MTTQFDQNMWAFLVGGLIFLAFVIFTFLTYSRNKKKHIKPAPQIKPNEMRRMDQLISKGGPSGAPRDKEETHPAVTPTPSRPTPITGTLIEPRLPQEMTETPVVEKEITVAEALSKTESNFFGRIKRAFSNPDKKVVLDEIEEILYTSDLGPQTVERLLEAVKSDLSKKEMSDISTVKLALQREMREILEPVQNSLETHTLLEEQIEKAPSGPTVIMIVGVNGAGKTTSIGKITAQLAQKGKKVLVAAGDTFRAAAGNQLKAWTERAQAAGESKGEVEIFWPANVLDPSAVAFDAVQKGKAQNYDYVILDTAGRLHTQANLMEELKKVKRVMAKVITEAPHETWIVLDANSGQNALLQAKEFHQALSVTGVILTKMDGTAKGGVALGLVDQLQIPIKLIGIGEKVSDLRLFKHTEYVDSILGL